MGSIPPTSVIRDGAVKASIWENEGEKGTYFTTTFAKTYRDKNGDLRDTNVFTNNDLLKISELAREARAKTRDLQQDRSQSNAHINVTSQDRTDDNRKDRAEVFSREHVADRSIDRDYGIDR